MEKGVSVIIPTLNEEANIEFLTKRLMKSLFKNNITFELVFIDDHSTDKTKKEILKFSKIYPVSFYLKKGLKGKAQSILEGVHYAKYEVVAMIDADLQYPPEAIPDMFKKINSGLDIVVTNRIEHKESLLRKILSRSYSFVFNKLLHDFDYDVQSGLKVFKKEIIERIRLHPTPWTFDLEFLFKARMAGYKIGKTDIVFSKRLSGKSKVKLMQTIFEIGFSAIRLKLKKSEAIPFSRNMMRKEGIGFHYKGKKFIPYTNLSHSQTALNNLSNKQLLFLSIAVMLFVDGMYVNWHTSLVILVGILTVIYLGDFIFNIFLIMRSFSQNPEIDVSKKEIDKVVDNHWPKYTIFCPLYKEWQVLPQFISAISNLDYPKSKLQVILLFEENDMKTIEKVKEFTLPAFFEVVIVPDSIPKTKPKALNYGLKFMRGEYAVVYDAEDVPDPLQLKKAVLAYKKVNPKTGCLQAKLNFFNPHQNLLTKIFTTEYSLWFDLILTGLQSINAPIPLGGTSNHFRAKDLIKLKGWDAFNVTEDCDLGIRLFNQGFQTQILNSTTLEEANSNLLNWLRQRSRWIKGYIQTYFVHTRTLKYFRQPEKRLHFFTFQLVVGGKVLTMFINPVMWFITLSYFIFRPLLGSFIESFFPPPIFYMGIISFILGNFLYFYYYMIGAAKRKHFELVKYAYLAPFYWLAMSIAGWYALYNFVKNPHYWAKTIHGLHLGLTTKTSYHYAK